MRALPRSARRAIPASEVRHACARVAARILHFRGLRALADIHAAVEGTLDRLDTEPTVGGAIEAQVERLVKSAMGPDLTPSGSTITDRRRRNPVPPAALSPVHALRELLYACVHPALPPDHQSSALLCLGFWLPNDAAATVLQTGPSTVGIHLRQCWRRLGAVARRSGTLGMTGKDARCLSLLRLFDRLRHRGAELQATAPGIAAALDTETRLYASLLVDSESGVAQGEAHAFLAQVLLGAERARRQRGAGGPGPPLSAGASSADHATATGLRHLRIAQELGAQDRFLWLARIHAGYLAGTGKERIDWQHLVGLYEGLLRTVPGAVLG